MNTLLNPILRHAMVASVILRAAEGVEGGKPAKEPKAPKEPKPEKPKLVTQNDVSRPANGTKTAAVWDIADRISATNRRAALREEVMAAGLEAGLNKGTIATQYARWTQFHGVSSAARSTARAAVREAEAAAAAAAGGQAE